MQGEPKMQNLGETTPPNHRKNGPCRRVLLLHLPHTLTPRREAMLKNMFFCALLCVFTLLCAPHVDNAWAADKDKPYLGTWVDASGKKVHTYIFSENSVDYKIDGKSQRKFPSSAAYAHDGKGYTVTLSGMKFFYLEIKGNDAMNVCDAWNKKNCVPVTRKK